MNKLTYEDFKKDEEKLRKQVMKLNEKYRKFNLMFTVYSRVKWSNKDKPKMMEKL